MKIIYACPFYNSTGHQRSATFNETTALIEAGHQVFTVLGERKFNGFTRWFVMLGETWEVLHKAIKLYKENSADFIYVRDGDPFLFVSHLLSCWYRGINWMLSLTAGIVFRPKIPRRFDRDAFMVWWSALFMSFINCSVWYPFYKFAQAGNKFIYLPQNPLSVLAYEEYIKGVFKGKVKLLRLGIPQVETIERDKVLLKLNPRKRFALLHFGSNHVGKDLETVFKGMRDLDCQLIYAGANTVSLSSDPLVLASEYNIWERLYINNSYINERDKKFYFAIADVVILSYTKEFHSTTSMLFEACAYGKPVVASRSGELSRLVEENGLGLTYEPGDIKGFVEAVNTIKVIKDDLVNNCLAFAEKNSQSNWTKNLITISKGGN